MSQTIDTATARHMAKAGTIRGVSIIGQSSGWSVMLKVGQTEKPLGGQRTDKPRTWRSLAPLIHYLRDVLRIVRVDASTPRTTALKAQSNAADQMRPPA